MKKNFPYFWLSINKALPEVMDYSELVGWMPLLLLVFHLHKPSMLLLVSGKSSIDLSFPRITLSCLVSMVSLVKDQTPI